MADGILSIDGFEKYGPNNGKAFNGSSNNLYDGAALPTGMFNGGMGSEWGLSSVGGSKVGLMTGLATSGAGSALCITSGNTGTPTYVSRLLPSNLTHLTVGFALMTDRLTNVGVNFVDAAIAVQCSCYVDTSGRVNVARSDLKSGANNLYQSAALVAASTRHYLEIDLVLGTGTSGSFKVWLDGALLTTVTSVSTQAGANNRVNQLYLQVGGSGTNGTGAFDDFYVADNTGGTFTPPGDVTIIGLTPSADAAVQFGRTATAVGPYYRQQTTTTVSTGQAVLLLVPVTPASNCTLNSVSFVPQTTSGMKFKGVVYSDSAGAPGSLLSSGTEVVGIVANVPATGPLVTPQSLVGGTQYWVGIICDGSFSVQQSDAAATTGQSKANTYASGAPAGPLSGMTTGQHPYCMWGNATGSAGTNSAAEALANGAPAFAGGPAYTFGYNGDSTVGHEDLFTTAGLPGIPSSIVAVQVSAMLSKDAPGARTADLRAKSGATDGAGSASGFAPSTTPQWFRTLFSTDPNTGSPWTAPAVNALQIGYKVAS